jgi:predicted RNase H-like nuclease
MIVLGIDAAWTVGQPSGVAVVATTLADDSWQCLALAPSYASFLGLAAGRPVDWVKGAVEEPVAPLQILDSACTLAGQRPTVIAVDMPVASTRISGRRPGDDALSRAFGARGCSTHTPSTSRPGAVGERMSRALGEAGYPVATTTTRAGEPRRLIEVYPHPALLALLDADYRIPYKVSKARRLWPGTTVQERIGLVLRSLARILDALEERIDGIALQLPEAAEVPSLSFLKRYEDAIDALVCAWVGMEYLEGRAVPFGDECSAIWVPTGADRA